MEVKTQLINYRYVIFGDFSVIYNNIQSIASLFSVHYTKQLVSETIFLNSFPQMVNAYVLASDEITLKFLPNRIDFFVRDLTVDTSDLSLVMRCLGTLQKFLSSCKVLRIAINLEFFYHDTENRISNKLCNRINLLNGPKNAREMSIRQNQILNIDNFVFNDIITIQKCGLQNKETFENDVGMALFFDLNSDPEAVKLIENDKLRDLFNKMKTNIINEKKEIEGILL